MPPPGIDDPPRRDFSPRATASWIFTGCDGRGRHIQVERGFEVGRDRDRDRIGAESRLAAAERRDMFWRTPESAAASPIMPLAHRHHRIGGQPPDMALPEHGAGRDVGCSRSLSIVIAIALALTWKPKPQ